jgi:hypothetical protein
LTVVLAAVFSTEVEGVRVVIKRASALKSDRIFSSFEHWTFVSPSSFFTESKPRRTGTEPGCSAAEARSGPERKARTERMVARRRIEDFIEIF